MVKRVSRIEPIGFLLVFCSCWDCCLDFEPEPVFDLEFGFDCEFGLDFDFELGLVKEMPPCWEICNPILLQRNDSPIITFSAKKLKKSLMIDTLLV